MCMKILIQNKILQHCFTALFTVYWSARLQLKNLQSRSVTFKIKRIHIDLNKSLLINKKISTLEIPLFCTLKKDAI